MTKDYRTLIAIGLLSFAAGTLVGTQTRRIVDRPFLRALAGAAKLGLRLLVFEPPPQERPVESVSPEYVDHYRSL